MKIEFYKKNIWLHKWVCYQNMTFVKQKHEIKLERNDSLYVVVVDIEPSG